MQVSGKWKVVKWVSIVLNLLSELCQAILTQENGQGKIGTSSYLKLSIITSSCCFLLSVVEIIHEAKKSRLALIGRPRRDICWQGQLPGRFFLYFGIVSSSIQFIIDLVALLRKENVVKFGIVPLVLSSGYLVAALVDPGENSMILLRIHTSFPFFAIRRTISSLSQRSHGEGQQELVPQTQEEAEAPLLIRPPNMVKLKSSDGEMFEVEEAVAMQSGILRSRIEDGCPDDIIPVPNVTGRILGKLMEYCEKHAKELSDEEELKTWDAEFVKVDDSTLFDLIIAANYLEIQSLLDLTTQAVADKMKGRPPQEIRQAFNADFTGEEEEEIRRENQWAFD